MFTYVITIRNDILLYLTADICYKFCDKIKPRLLFENNRTTYLKNKNIMDWSSFFQNFPQAVKVGVVLHLPFDLQNSTPFLS